jgi:Asp/Glu/hydantoin racemase
MTRIAFIHALEESVLPARAALARNWPDAFAFDLLDTSLAIDLAYAGGRLDGKMMDRFSSLARYAAANEGRGGELRGILFTCSAFGPAIDRVKTEISIPVLRPNESAFRQALKLGNKLGLIVTFAPSAKPLENELQDMAEAARQSLSIKTLIVADALVALKAGNGEEHDRLVAAAARKLGQHDAVILGQFSLARAASAVASQGFGDRVITTPDAALKELRQFIEANSRERPKSEHPQRIQSHPA